MSTIKLQVLFPTTEPSPATHTHCYALCLPLFANNPHPPPFEMKKKRNHVQWVKTHQAVEDGFQEMLKV